jgi:hypothetical protein
MADGIKPTRIVLEGWPIPDELSIDAVYTGDDADWDEAPGVGGEDQWKQPVRAATTAAVTIATALNAGDTLDGVTLAAGDRVLVKDQGTASENGIYVVGATPARAADMDADAEAVGAVVYVVEGTANAGTAWAVTNDAVVVDTDAMDWAAFGGGGPGSAVDTSLSTVAASGASETLDVSVARTHDVTLTADCTFTFTGAVAAEAHYFTLVLRQDGTGGWDATWPGSVVWPGGVAPTLDTTASTLEVLTFFTLDGGTVWYGFPTGGGGDPATTVESETSFGLAAAVGTDTAYARQDHTHGSPANPVTVAALEAIGVRGELVVADGTSGAGHNPAVLSEMETERSTTSASLEDITGSTLDITLQQAGKIAVTMAFSCYTVSGAASSTIAFSVSIDGTDHDEMQRYLSGTSDRGIGALTHLSDELAAGTYTVKGRFRRVSGTATPGTDHVSLVALGTAHDGPVLVTTEDATDYVYADLGA